MWVGGPGIDTLTVTLVLSGLYFISRTKLYNGGQYPVAGTTGPGKVLVAGDRYRLPGTGVLPTVSKPTTTRATAAVTFAPVPHPDVYNKWVGQVETMLALVARTTPGP